MKTELKLVPATPQHPATPIGVMTTANAAAPLELLRGRVEAALFGTAPAITAIGRFQIIEEVGAGGMGVVYAAHDPQLDRTIALKVLHQRARSPEARTRMVREAKAMARLRHPNVLTVFETGAHNEQVYIAMEFVEGGTLRQWMERDTSERSWREIIETITQAGRGLAAAHDEGLVHRDFKPANALIDSSGRVLVSDFGLARAGAETPLALASPALSAGALERTEVEAGDSSDLLRATLTRTGALLGTPAYMSPEQFARDHATPRSDQFAFCVVLYEALFGRRPFAGQSIGELVANIERGAIVKPTGRRVPAAVLAVIERGLSPDPAARFPSMHTLLDALQRATNTRRSARWLAPAGASAALAFGIAVLVTGPEASSSAPVSACAELERGTLALWNDDRRELIRGALSDALDDLAGARFAALNDTLTRYATRLAAKQRARCEERDTHDGTLAAASMIDVCLEDRRNALETFVQTTADRADGAWMTDPGYIKAAGVEHADTAAELLPSIAACDLRFVHEALSDQPTPKSRQRDARHSLAIAGALRPRALTLAPHLDRAATRELREQSLRGATRVSLAHAILEYQHAQPADRARTREAYSTMASIALGAERAGDQETRARAWTLAAELLLAGEHSEVALQQAITQGFSALNSLPQSHTLQRPLRRDLGVIALTYASQTTAEDSCVQAVDNPLCKHAFQAVNILSSIPKTPDDLGREADADSLDAALLAKASQRVDPSSLTTSARAAADALDLRELPYLDFSAGELVSSKRMPLFTIEDHEQRERLREFSRQISCSESLCRLDRAFVEALTERTQEVIGDLRVIPALKDGVSRGIKLYAIRTGSIGKQLRFKNGDLLTAVNGIPLSSVDVMAAPNGPVQSALRGDSFTLTVERKGEIIERRFEIVEKRSGPRDETSDVTKAESASETAGPPKHLDRAARAAMRARHTGALPSSAPAIPPAELARKLALVTCSAPGERCSMSRAQVRELIVDNPSALAPDFHIKPARVNGERRGIQLVRFSETSLAWTLGLRPGDVITKAFGLDLSEQGMSGVAPTQLQAIMDGLDKAARFEVEYDRDGDARWLVVSITNEA